MLALCFSPFSGSSTTSNVLMDVCFSSKFIKNKTKHELYNVVANTQWLLVLI